MSKLKKSIDVFLFETYDFSTDALGLYRICYASFFLIFGVPNFTWIAENPDAFHFPPLVSFSVFFNGFPSFWILQFVSITCCILFVLLLFGYHTRLVSIMLPFVIIIGESFSYSFGKIDHDLIIWLVPLFLTFAGWENKFSMDSLNHSKYKNRDYKNWPISFMAVALGFAFFTAGFEKLLGGWLDITTQASQYYILQSSMLFDREVIADNFLLSVLPDFVWEVGDWIVVWFEILFLAAAYRLRFFRKWVFAALFFHLFIFLAMGITTSWLYIVYMLFADWKAIFNIFNKEVFANKIEKFYTTKTLSITLIIFLIIYLFGQNILEHPGLHMVGIAPLLAGLMRADYYLFFGVITVLSGVSIGSVLAYVNYKPSIITKFGKK